MELYFIRHGESANNALTDAADRVSDPPLTETGTEQAERVARCLGDASLGSDELALGAYLQNRCGFTITRLFCSPMLRAMQTAAPIAKALGISPEVWMDVHEQGGIWLDHDDGRGSVGYPGLGRSEMVTQFPDYRLPDGIPEDGWWNRPQEAEHEWIERADRVARDLRGRYTGTEERVAIVTHGGFTNSMIHALLNNGELEEVYFSHQNTGITRIDIEEDGFVRMRYLNRLEHLPRELVT